MNQNERIRRQRDTANEELHALEHGMKYFHNHLTGEEQVVRRTDDLIKVETCRFYFKDLQAKLAAAESKLKAVDAFIKLLKEDHAKQLAAAETKIKELEELCEKGNIARGQLAWRAARMESDEKLIRELRADIQRLQNCQETPQPSKLEAAYALIDETKMLANENLAGAERGWQEIDTLKAKIKELEAEIAKLNGKLQAANAYIEVQSEDVSKLTGLLIQKRRIINALEANPLKATPQPADRITPPYQILGIYVTLVDGKVQAVSWNPDRQTQERSTTLKDEDF